MKSKVQLSQIEQIKIEDKTMNVSFLSNTGCGDRGYKTKYGRIGGGGKVIDYTQEDLIEMGIDLDTLPDVKTKDRGYASKP